jgi:hypothetical protein
MSEWVNEWIYGRYNLLGQVVNRPIHKQARATMKQRNRGVDGMDI